jgi:hypothetical protein
VVEEHPTADPTKLDFEIRLVMTEQLDSITNKTHGLAQTTGRTQDGNRRIIETLGALARHEAGRYPKCKVSDLAPNPCDTFGALFKGIRLDLDDGHEIPWLFGAIEEIVDSVRQR